MIDADGKLESGQLYGNLLAEGSFDICKNVREDFGNEESIRGQYVLGWWYGPEVSIYSSIFLVHVECILSLLIRGCFPDVNFS